MSSFDDSEHGGIVVDGPGVAALPDDLILSLLDQLDLHERLRVARSVCKQWRRAWHGLGVRVVVVDGRGGEHGYQRISDAVATAAPGQATAVCVAPGRYREESFCIDSDVHIVGAHGAELVAAFPGATLSLTGPCAPSLHGVSFVGGSVTVSGGCRALLHGCTVRSDRIGVVASGEGTEAVLRGCTVALQSPGVVVTQRARALLDGCVFEGGNLVALSAAEAVARGCRFRGQSLAVAATGGARAALEGCRFEAVGLPLSADALSAPLCRFEGNEILAGGPCEEADGVDPGPPGP